LNLALPRARVTELVALSPGRGKSFITDAKSLRKENRWATSSSNMARDHSPTEDRVHLSSGAKITVNLHQQALVKDRDREQAECSK
jgi:hypothetical protein